MVVKRCSLERLKELVKYDPETGIFVRIKGGRGLPPVGSVLGCVNGRGYLIAMIDYRIYLLHQLAWFYTHGEWVDTLDHENGQKSNNRICNLRPATGSQNNANKKISKANSSGYKGVSWADHAQKFRAGIKVNGRSIHLGYRDAAQDAHKLYKDAAKKYFGDFARVA